MAEFCSRHAENMTEFYKLQERVNQVEHKAIEFEGRFSQLLTNLEHLTESLDRNFRTNQEIIMRNQERLEHVELTVPRLDTAMSFHSERISAMLRYWQIAVTAVVTALGGFFFYMLQEFIKR